MGTSRKGGSLATWEHVCWLAALGAQSLGSCLPLPASTAASLAGSIRRGSSTHSAQHLGSSCIVWPSPRWALRQVCRLREAQGLRSVLARRGSFAMTWPSNDASPASPSHNHIPALRTPRVPGSLSGCIYSSCICTHEQFASLSLMLRLLQALITQPQGRGESAHCLTHPKPRTHVPQTKSESFTWDFLSQTQPEWLQNEHICCQLSSPPLPGLTRAQKLAHGLRLVPNLVKNMGLATTLGTCATVQLKC